MSGDLFGGGLRRDAEIVGNCRLWLTRTWSDRPAALFFMTNPSDADALRDDPTTLRGMAFADRWGYGAWWALNCSPVISSSPAVLPVWFGASRREGTAEWIMRRRNLEVIRDFAARAGIIVVAFGNSLPAGAEIGLELAALRSADHTLFCLGVNADGSPKHPLARGRHRVPGDQQPIPWEPRP